MLPPPNRDGLELACLINVTLKQRIQWHKLNEEEYSKRNLPDDFEGTPCPICGRHWSNHNGHLCQHAGPYPESETHEAADYANKWGAWMRRKVKKDD